MQADLRPSPDVETAPAPLPERRFLCGPVTAGRIAWLGVAYAGLFSLGAAIAGLSERSSWAAFGLGLMIPGGGFLARADVHSWQGALQVGLAAGALMALAVALLLWLATGNVLAPPLTWLLSAVAAAVADPGDSRESAVFVAGVTMTAIGAMAGYAWVKRFRAIAQRRASEAYLRQLDYPALKARWTEGARSVAEFTLQELKLMRFLLDRALQPPGSYDGFEWLDQFQTAAVRYQLNFMGYALSMAQATRLPALGGYLTAAQRNLIDKLTDHRIWRYWRLENAWGNLATDPDPIARENVMFAGFAATQIVMYHAASGRSDYDRRGSFVLRHSSGRTYDYDLESMMAAVHRGQGRSAFHLMACEPNWIYPLCNSIAAAGMKARDRLTGGDRWSRTESEFRRNLENEFIDLAGRLVPGRSSRTGLALPPIGGALPEALTCFFLNATLPDIALRQWLLLRRDLIRARASRHELMRQRFWPLDTGNYRFSRAAAFAGTALAAGEFGDQEVARLCRDALDEECPAISDAKACYRPKASVWSHAVEFFANSVAENAFGDLIRRPRQAAPRPFISDLCYPQVLVARASHAPGLLSAVLYPGEQAGRFELGLSGLVPDSLHGCEGTEQESIRADREGRANITVALTGRTEIQVRSLA